MRNVSDNRDDLISKKRENTNTNIENLSVKLFKFYS